MKTRFKKSVIVLLTIYFVVTGMTSLYATKMLHRNAEELASLAHRVFVGECVSVEEKEVTFSNGASLTYTEYTFQVERSIKGPVGGTVVLRQLGRARGLGSIIGMPFYENGKKYLLCLREDSEYGLASPIGLGQGAFQLYKDDKGTEQAINALGNQGLFHRMDAKSFKYSTLSIAEKSLIAATKGPVDFNNFVSLMQKLAR